MYADPRHIKHHRVNARFNDPEISEIELIAELTGVQKSTLVRKATLRFIQELKEEFMQDLHEDKEAS